MGRDEGRERPGRNRCMTSVSAAPVAGGEVPGDGLPEPVRDALGELAGAA
jgi:hypothetical protein